jgi:hypothetical protein
MIILVLGMSVNIESSAGTSSVFTACQFWHSLHTMQFYAKSRTVKSSCVARQNLPIFTKKSQKVTKSNITMTAPITGLLLIFIEKTDKPKIIQPQSDQTMASLVDNQSCQGLLLTRI